MGKSPPNRFDQVMLPHLDAAYNLARWLSGSATEADDVVQEAFLRAFRFFDGYTGDNPRAWLLAIVRNTWFTEWRKHHHQADSTPYDDSLQVDEQLPGWSDESGDDPEKMAVRQDETDLVHRALAMLPVEFREVIVLRELEDMSYKDVAQVAGIPIGTVMSRLSRARRLLCSAVRIAQGNPEHPAIRLVKTPPAGAEESKRGN
ncbi:MULTISPECIES: RNA polymerase sigma factor [Burkholderiaceae]|jgi:RNA polymerase sigma-70 factor (ECF subfamily)|uniref:RNA polymerase sigma factor n=1 Tax=Caballeronia sordidicola TaxID=196367 RepID=A0A242MT32_CABSO|nr:MULTISPECIES: RNA polymerase sigma factor [Burkholderiaceae]AME25626.1 RNA polymerase subunit sigma [Burkholderia sp. PAMC 26561]OTP74546.1 RNA polymerase sigma factor [Caballeronia sordidicola]